MLKANSTTNKGLKFSLKDKRTRMMLGGAAAAAVIGGMVLSGTGGDTSDPIPTVTPSAPAVTDAAPPALPIPSPQPVEMASADASADSSADQPIPFDGHQRVAEMDMLQGTLEKELMLAKIAKAKAEARDAASGLTSATPATGSGGALPPLPAFPAGGINSLMPPASSLDMPPLPSRGGGSGGSSLGATSGVQLLEAWGIGNDRQARVSTSSGEKIVRVGDSLNGGKVVSISSSAVVIEARGKKKVIE